MFLLHRYYVVFALVMLCWIGIAKDSYSLDRWFRFSPGIRAGFIGSDLFSQERIGQHSANLNFWVGFNFNFALHRRFGIDVDVIYTRKGSFISKADSSVELHYISIPTIAKGWILPEILSINLGLAHNFLVFPKGQFQKADDSLVTLTYDNLHFYELSLVAGLSYVFKEFENDIRIVGDIGCHIGITNIFKPFKPTLYNLVVPYVTVGVNF